MRLQKIVIEIQKWGDNKGKYEGTITFENGEKESFTFGLTPETCQKYLVPVADQVISSAKELGAKLAQSFTRELEPPKQTNHEQAK